MTRKQAIDLIRIAGYHNDYKKFMRLYTENRISYETAKRAFSSGIESKERSVKCACYECNKVNENETGKLNLKIWTITI